MKKGLLTAALISLPVSAVIARPYGCDYQLFPGGGIIMWILTVVLSIILIYFLYSSIKHRNSGKVSDSQDPVAILKARLARGEISEEEYERLKSRVSE